LPLKLISSDLLGTKQPLTTALIGLVDFQLGSFQVNLVLLFDDG